MRASLGLFGLGPDRLTVPLLAAVYRAVLGDADFGLHLAGPSGSFKSEAAALVQQHFGSGLDARHLPAAWSWTGNALEALAFAAKDCVLVVDDFCPAGSSSDVQRLHKDADRLFRGQGNHSGRGRLRADATLRPPKPPRGLVLSTGEDMPRGQSLRARVLVLEVSPGDFGPLQPAPRTRRSAGASPTRPAASTRTALAGYLRWVAADYPAARSRLKAEAARLREEVAAEGQHARTPGIVADLAAALMSFLDFAESARAVTPAQRAKLWERCLRALRDSAGDQADQIGEAEPADRFLRLLAAAVAAGYAHVADENGDAPENESCWGWRAEEHGTGDNVVTHLRPKGNCIGWTVGDALYLEPEASYAAVQRFARDQGDGFAVSARTLRKRLDEKGHLVAKEGSRQKLTVRKTLQGCGATCCTSTRGRWLPLKNRPDRPGRPRRRTRRGPVGPVGPVAGRG